MRTRNPQQQRSRTTKTRLLDAGERLIRRKGFHGTDSKEIASQAGVAIGSFYAYFNDKKDLFVAVLNRYTERIFSSVPDLPAEGLNADNGGRLIREYVWKVIRAHDLPELHRELFVVMGGDPDLNVLVERWQRESVRRLEISLNSAAGRLRVRDTKTAAVLLHAVLEAAIQRLTLYRVEVQEERLMEELGDMFSRYLLSGGDV